MTALFNLDGDLIAAPQRGANDNSQIAALGAAIGKYVDPSLPASWGGMDGHDASLTTTPYGLPVDNLPPVVAFTGQAASGKSTATRHLVEQHGYTLVKFAGPLKDMCRAIGLTESQIEGDDKEKPTRLLQGKSPRQFMQLLGSEFGRDMIGKDFWIFLWEHAALKIKDAGGRVVTDDCRFPNEAQAIRKLGGDIFKLDGRGGIAGGHVSERGCGDEDLVIVNDGPVAALHEKVEEALRRYG